MRKLQILMVGMTTMLLSACTSHTSGVSEMIKIDTLPRKTAHCVVENENDTLDIYSTPRYLDISRAKGPLSVTCRTMDGWHGHATVESALEPMAVAGTVLTGAAVAGAVVLTQPHVAAVAIAGAAAGGGIGSATFDAAKGSAFRYPENVVVMMTNETPALPEAYAHGVDRAPDPAPMTPMARPAVSRHVYHHPVVPPCQCDTAQKPAASKSP